MTATIHAHTLGDLRGQIVIETDDHGLTIMSRDPLGFRWTLTDQGAVGRVPLTGAELLAELRQALDAAETTDACPACGRERE